MKEDKKKASHHRLVEFELQIKLQPQFCREREREKERKQPRALVCHKDHEYLFCPSGLWYCRARIKQEKEKERKAKKNTTKHSA